jgi:ATP-binding cassette, subfamily B, bacterial
VSAEESAGRVTVFDVWGPARHRRRQGIGQLLLESVRLAWRAAPRDLAAITVMQTLSALAVTAQVLIARSLLAGLLHADQVHGRASALIPQVIELTAATAALGVAQAIALNRQRLLAERCARYGEDAVIAVTGRASLSMFDESGFHDQVARARVAVQRLPAVAMQLAALGRALAGALGALVALIAMTPLFAPLLLIVAAPAWLASRSRGLAFHRFASGFTPADRERQYLAELLIVRDAAKEVRAYGLQEHLRARHDRLWRERIAGLDEVARPQLGISIGAELVASALIALTLVGLILLTLDHHLSLASAGAAAAAIVVLAQRIAFAASSVGGLSESALFLKDYLDLVGPAGPTSRQSAPRAKAPARTSTLHVRAEGVTFTYPNARMPALVDVSLEISPGQVVALVGENGSGKSTLAKLLAGLYAPDHGTVTWNGLDAANGDSERLRESIAVIFQDFQRYALTARENIGLGDAGRIADLDAIERAAVVAGADAVVRQLPDGYATLLGPEFLDGSDLSLGQWQRVALARAVFRDAPFVILDEPTASLDAHAEYAMFERIGSVLAGHSVLLISHRLASVRRADQILVLDQGRIEERGTHDELIARGGRYAAMFALQAEPYR